MAFTLDRSTSIGKLRVRLSDTEASDAVFQDEDLQEFLAEGGSIDRAWARAVLAWVTTVGWRQRLARSHGIEADPAVVMRDLRILATTILDRFDASDATSDSDEFGGLFDIAELVYGDFGYRERLASDALRSLP